MAEGNSKGLTKAPKITNRGDDDVVVGFDRLSDLPDSILHHILSFLDTKSLFQTGFLSRRWGCMWKEVPALYFSCNYFRSMSSFEQHVLKFLSLRSNNSAAVSSVTFKAWSWKGKDSKSCFLDLFDRVMKHAASQGPRRSLHHLSICLSTLDCRPDFVDSAASIKAHHHHESLKTLNLKLCTLTFGGTGATPFSGFNLLTNLELKGCHLYHPVEPFVDLPCLKHLKLVDCNPWSSSLLKVSGSELLDLQIQNPVERSGKVEVFAPKLKSFCFWGCVEQLGQLNLPSLDQASIRVRIKQMEATNRACVKLLPQLHNVESLNFRFDKVTKNQGRWEQHEFPLISSTELLAGLEVSPFTRLKSLKVHEIDFW
ncbi:unnamed protein product [Linum trigynum]|uniref:F-box domain-containing protein n=1 Tax=Linum trigynum TaxID=586398 RepID=A0AAV2EJ79_9ROSI